jgi:hypothetical protein
MVMKKGGLHSAILFRCSIATKLGRPNLKYTELKSMKKNRRTTRPQSRNNRFDFERLETRNMLANDVLPDIFAWESESRGYLHDYVVEGDLLRFTTAFANKGAGNLEVFGGDVLENGNQEVLQRIYDDEGGWRDRVAGEFTYHSGHGHIHFDGYAIYNLREIGPSGEVGDILATGGKISFCLIDITKYDSNAGSSNYGSCGTTQGVTAGWSDVYSRNLADQWINISGIDDGDYYLEVVTDPENQLEESDETNNTTIITITIQDGPGAQGDRFEPNNSFATAFNLGMFSERNEPGLSIHTDQDVDYYQFNAVEHGEFEIHVNFSHDLGNIDAFVYDNEFNLIASGDSLDDLEDLHFHTHPDQAYYLKVLGVGGDTNGYDLQFFGPGEVVSDTVMSDDVPVDIPDGNGSSTPGQTATSTLEGPDFTLTDLNLIFADLHHTWMGDLHIDITSPSGTTATIIRSQWESPGGPLGGEDNFINTLLDDQAPINIDDGTAPYSGSYNVNFGDVSNPLSVFNGETSLGTWTVSITDWFSADTGTLNAWGLTFTGIDNNPGDALEQNDAFPQATDLGIIGTVGYTDLSIHKQSDVDFFRFIAQDSTEVRIDLGFLHNDGNLDFAVYDSNQQVIGLADSINDNESLVVPVEEGELYFVQVYGMKGATNTYTFDIDVPLLVAESGKIGLTNEQWRTVNLQHAFDNPVVIVSAPGYNDRSAVTVEVENVTSTSFDVRLHNWHVKIPNHTAENLSYFVVEAGTHTLRDGTVIMAGHHDASDTSWTDVDFASSFGTIPLVFTQLDHSSTGAYTTRLTNIDENGFSILAQGAELVQPQDLTFQTHWLAIEPGTGNSDNGIFEVGHTGERITDQPERFGFAGDFNTTPSLILTAQTTNENDTAGVRLVSANNQIASILMEEETSLDSERKHIAEDVGYLAFLTDNNFYAMEPQPSSPNGYMPGPGGFSTGPSGFAPLMSNDGSGESPIIPAGDSGSRFQLKDGNNLDSRPSLASLGKLPMLDASFAKLASSGGTFSVEEMVSIKKHEAANRPSAPGQIPARELALVSIANQRIESVIRDQAKVESLDNGNRKTISLVDGVFQEFKLTLN